MTKAFRAINSGMKDFFEHEPRYKVTYKGQEFKLKDGSLQKVT